MISQQIGFHVSSRSSLVQSTINLIICVSISDKSRTESRNLTESLKSAEEFLIQFESKLTEELEFKSLEQLNENLQATQVGSVAAALLG